VLKSMPGGHRRESLRTARSAIRHDGHKAAGALGRAAAPAGSSIRSRTRPRLLQAELTCGGGMRRQSGGIMLRPARRRSGKHPPGTLCLSDPPSCTVNTLQSVFPNHPLDGCSRGTLPGMPVMHASRRRGNATHRLLCTAGRRCTRADSHEHTQRAAILQSPLGGQLARCEVLPATCPSTQAGAGGRRRA